MRSSFLVCFKFAPKLLLPRHKQNRQYSTKLKTSIQMSILGFYGINGVEKTDIGAHCIHSHLIHRDRTVNMFNEALRSAVDG